MKTKYITSVSVLILASACSDGGNAGDEATTTPVSGSSSTNASTTTGGASVAPNGTESPAPVAPISSTPAVTSAGPTTAVSPQSETAGETSGGTPTTDGPNPSEDTSAPEPVTGGSGEASSSTTSPASETTGESSDVVDVGADEKFSFFVTSYHHIALLAGSDDGFGGDLRYNGAATGLEGADAICQEIARRVAFGHRTWKAYLSTSTVNAIDRIGNGPWYDFLGAKVADSPQDLITGANRQPGGCCETGTYDEMGLFHDGSTDQNNDGVNDDDHDTMTATNEDGTYAGFSCEDWTSTTATSGETGGGGGGGFGGGGGGGGIMMGHSWPARSGEHWATSHGGHQCAAGTNFVQDGAGDASTVGGGGGYGGFYCFALSE